jgi:hypothetical protein
MRRSGGGVQIERCGWQWAQAAESGRLSQGGLRGLTGCEGNWPAATEVALQQPRGAAAFDPHAAGEQE